MRLRVVLFLAQRRAIRLTILDINESPMSQRHGIKRGVRQVQMTPIVSFTPAAVSLIARVRVSTWTRIRNHDGDALRAGVDASLRVWKSVCIVKLYESRVVKSSRSNRVVNATHFHTYRPRTENRIFQPALATVYTHNLEALTAKISQTYRRAREHDASIRNRIRVYKQTHRNRIHHPC